MHRIVVMIGVVLCLVAIATYSFWPVEDDYEMVTDPADTPAN